MDTDTGEVDLEVTPRNDTGDTKLLVEVKLDAGLQPRQAERYRERAAALLARGDCVSVLIMILAPGAFFPDDQDALGFGRRVKLESVLHWFNTAETLANRRYYKTALLREALGGRVTRDSTSQGSCLTWPGPTDRSIWARCAAAWRRLEPT